MILIAQIASVGFLALWLTTGVRDNILYPSLNETFTAEVMEMTRLRRDYPECYALMAHRRIESRFVQRIVFRLIVVWEAIAALALWAGVAALLGSAFSLLDS